jgi:hypothetical protein
VVYGDIDPKEKRAVDAMLIGLLRLAADPSEPSVGTRPKSLSIAILIQRGWLRLNHVKGLTYELSLTRAGARELEHFRQNPQL